MSPEELERRRIANRKYWNKHKDRINAKKRERLANDPEYATHVRARATAYREKHRDKLNKNVRDKEANDPEYNARRRLSHSENYWRRKEETKSQIFHILGDKCMVCGETEPVCFDIHHVNERQKRSSDALTKWRDYLKQAEAGEDIILLCSNCHRKYHSGVINL